MKQQEALTNQESLEIITKMIHTAKGNIKGNSFQFLLWGWVVALGNIGQYCIAELTSYQHPYMIWLITIPAWIISFGYGARKAKEARVKTYGNSLIMWVWLAFLFSLLILIFSGQFGELIPALILIIAGICTFITGCILKFKPLIFGGSSFWVFSAIILGTDYSYATLISAVAIVVGYLIPGYILKKS